MFAGNFSRLDRWVHRLALGSAMIREVSFDLERSLALPKPSPAGSPGAADHAVYVCGLARSGTTVLLRILDTLPVFRSLTYRDMPFVLAPNLWRRIAAHSARQAAPAERAHGDGILVDYDSPEAFEEVFWQTVCGPVLRDGAYDTARPSREALQAFADYRAIVANPRTAAGDAAGHHRYLSKNNNNLVRLDALTTDPTATVLLVYRNPVATARSLFRQHERFCAVQAADAFARDYMVWLGHHEFGLAHLPFRFAAAAMDGALRPEQPDYWLDYWNAVYSHLLEQRGLRVHLVDHDAMRAAPRQALEAVFARLGVEADAEALAAQIRPDRQDSASPDGLRPDLVARATETWRALQGSPLNIDLGAVAV